MTSRKRNTILEEFIDIYKSEPCLWKLKSRDYHDRDKRAAAYERLVKKLQELEPDATKEDVSRKINTLRSNVRRERRKYEESVRSGASSDDFYKPKLWYYELFNFIGDPESRYSRSIGSRSNIMDNEDNFNDISTDDNIDNAHSTEKEYIMPKKKSRISMPRPLTIKTDPHLSDSDDFKTPIKDRFDLVGRTMDGDNFKRPIKEDRYDLLGRTIAIKLRSIDRRQRLIAEKIINDTLFDAEMGNLNTETYWAPQTSAVSPKSSPVSQCSTPTYN